MNILYLSDLDIKNKNDLGVIKKVNSQIESMTFNGNKVFSINIESENVIYKNQNEKIIIGKFKNIITKRKLLYNLKLIENMKIDNVNLVYIRLNGIDWILIKFLKELYKQNIKVLIEVPTYPYRKSITKKKLILDILFSRFMKKYVYNIILSSCKRESLYGIPVLFVDNCVNVKKMKLSKKTYDKDRLDIIGVSLVRNCVGYDRVINGLNEYYKEYKTKKKVYLHIVGDGTSIIDLKKKVEEYKLNEYVIFYGVKNGKELDAIFDKVDIGMGSFADHREGVAIKSPLKCREYCARGIPFITATKDLGFSENLDFILKFPSDESYIDIDKIIQFHNNLDLNIKLKTREYALNNFDWNKQYKKIFKDL